MADPTTTGLPPESTPPAGPSWRRLAALAGGLAGLALAVLGGAHLTRPPPKAEGGPAVRGASAARFDPPPELQRVEDPASQVYAGPDDLVDVSPGTPLLRDFERVGPAELQRSLAASYQLTDLSLRETSGDAARRHFAGEGTSARGERLRVTVLALRCPAERAGYLALHLGPVTGPAGRGLELLARVGCP